MVDNRIYYQNGNENKIYSTNTDGSDRKLLSDDSAEWLVVGDSRIYYTITGTKIYSISMDGGDKQLLADLSTGAYKDVTYEVDARLHEDMPIIPLCGCGEDTAGYGRMGARLCDGFEGL